MTRFCTALALLCLAQGSSPAGDDERLRWLKLEEALPRSSADGKPTAVFVATDLLVDGPPVKGMDRAFEMAEVRPHREDFHYVKCTDLKTVKAVRAQSKCELIVLDPDAADICRVVVRSPAEIAAALKNALALYARKPIAWLEKSPAPVDGVSGRPLLVLLFGDHSADEAAVVAALENRRVARIHERCVFVRVPWSKDAPGLQGWSVTKAPTLLLLDADREVSGKFVLERSSGKKTPREMKAFLSKGLAALERSRR